MGACLCCEAKICRIKVLAHCRSSGSGLIEVFIQYEKDLYFATAMWNLNYGLDFFSQPHSCITVDEKSVMLISAHNAQEGVGVEIHCPVQLQQNKFLFCKDTLHVKL